tara:strand:- start:671 stop:928 length:258 start_codon:yes stop_codon:yes gene_type:complete
VVLLLINKEVNKMNTNNMKRQTLTDMSELITSLTQKMRVLDALDRDESTSGAYDLNDQLVTMDNALKKLSAVTDRAWNVVPTDDL